jgi:putative transposase
VKTREAGRIVSVAVIIAVVVNTDGQREVLGLAVGASEAEPAPRGRESNAIVIDSRGARFSLIFGLEGVQAASNAVRDA